MTISFPLAQTTVTLTQPFDKSYTLKFKGNTVIDITPRETNPTAYPTYLRNHFKKKQAPMKTVQRFVAPVMLDW